MHVHLCVALWLFSPRLSLFSTSSHRSLSSPSRCSPQCSTRGPGPTPCATSAWGPWPPLTTRHPSHLQRRPKATCPNLGHWSQGHRPKERLSNFGTRSTVFWRSTTCQTFRTNPIQSVIDRGNLRTQNVFLWMKEKRPVHTRLLVNVCMKNLVLQIERGNLINCLKTSVLSVLTMEQGNLLSKAAQVHTQ